MVVILAVLGSVHGFIECWGALVSDEWGNVTGGVDAGVFVVLAVNGSVWLSIELW